MTEYNVGDRVLVPGVVMEIDQDRRYPYLIDGVWRSADSVRPDAGGRDLTANDVADAVREWTAEDTHYAQIAEELNRIARGDTGSAGDDTAPLVEQPVGDWWTETNDEADGPVLVARCQNYREDIDEPCTGQIRFRRGQPEAACGTCGSYCGLAVAAWVRVDCAAAGPRADDEPCVCHTGFTCTASEHDDTAPGVKCGVCDRPLALADPRYVHADGKTYRHPIRPVPAHGLLCNAPGDCSAEDGDTWRKLRAEWIDLYVHVSGDGEDTVEASRTTYARGFYRLARDLDTGRVLFAAESLIFLNHRYADGWQVIGLPANGSAVDDAALVAAGAVRVEER